MSKKIEIDEHTFQQLIAMCRSLADYAEGAGRVFHKDDIGFSMCAEDCQFARQMEESLRDQFYRNFKIYGGNNESRN